MTSTGPAGALSATFDSSGRVLTQSLDGALMATPNYDAAGAPDAAGAYDLALGGGNGTSLAIVRHAGTSLALAAAATGLGMAAAGHRPRSLSRGADRDGGRDRLCQCRSKIVLRRSLTGGG